MICKLSPWVCRSFSLFCCEAATFNHHLINERTWIQTIKDSCGFDSHKFVVLKFWVTIFSLRCVRGQYFNMFQTQNISGWSECLKRDTKQRTSCVSGLLEADNTWCHSPWSVVGQICRCDHLRSSDVLCRTSKQGERGLIPIWFPRCRRHVCALLTCWDKQQMCFCSSCSDRWRRYQNITRLSSKWKTGSCLFPCHLSGVVSDNI